MATSLHFSADSLNVNQPLSPSVVVFARLESIWQQIRQDDLLLSLTSGLKSASAIRGSYSLIHWWVYIDEICVWSDQKGKYLFRLFLLEIPNFPVPMFFLMWYNIGKLYFIRMFCQKNQKVVTKVPTNQKLKSFILSYWHIAIRYFGCIYQGYFC